MALTLATVIASAVATTLLVSRQETARNERAIRSAVASLERDLRSF